MPCRFEQAICGPSPRWYEGHHDAKCSPGLQTQMTKLQQKLDKSAAWVKAKDEELAELKQAFADARVSAQQVAVDGPRVEQLRADMAVLREELREAKDQRGEAAKAQDEAARAAGHAEGQAEERAALLQRAKVSSSAHTLVTKHHITSGHTESEVEFNRPNKRSHQRWSIRQHLHTALRAQDEAAAAQKEAAHQRALAAHAAHAARETEKRLERCRGQLAAGVAREERTLARNRDVYGRVRAAWAATKGTPRAPGAIAAAARELRAIEIVGIYEHAKAGADAELARLAAENLGLLEEVRQLENKAALLARERGGAGAASIEVRALRAAPTT
jgi:hypothetical protein